MSSMKKIVPFSDLGSWYEQVNRELLDVIESLKSKIEEGDASEKLCEEVIDGEEEGRDGSNGNESSSSVETTRKRAKVDDSE